MIFISHDIGVIGYVSDRVAVMYMGRIVELADARTIVERPKHPYSLALMAAVPRPDPSLRIAGAVRDERASEPVPSRGGCAYAPRCPLASERCRIEAPLLRDVGATQVACHHADG